MSNEIVMTYLWFVILTTTNIVKTEYNWGCTEEQNTKISCKLIACRIAYDQ